MNRQQIQDDIENALRDGCVNQQTVTLVLGSGEAVFHVEQSDSMAGSFNGIEYRSTAIDNLAKTELSRFAESLAARLTYLLEPISTIEADPDVVQLRSDPPSAEDNHTRCYFELLARKGSLSLVRYRKSVGQPRTLVPMQLTHEVLSRLLVDFDAAACSL